MTEPTDLPPADAPAPPRPAAELAAMGFRMSPGPGIVPPGSGAAAEPALYAVSDLHIAHPDNRQALEALAPRHPDDWLIVAGDVAELLADVGWALKTLASRFRTVVWAPGNHELWSHPHDPVQLRGVARYERLVEMCREFGVHTPEDPYPVWSGPGGPVTVAPLFVLYDYSFLPPGARDSVQGLEMAHEAGIVCTDEFLLHPDPYATRGEWCAARIAYTEERLAAADPELPTVLVNHFPLVRTPTDVLRYPVFAQWCGTERTVDWHVRFRSAAVVYGHLHIPRLQYFDGVPFEEVSWGYPREWKTRKVVTPLRQILPRP